MLGEKRKKGGSGGLVDIPAAKRRDGGAGGVVIIHTLRERHLHSCILSISACHRTKAVARIQSLSVCFLSDESKKEK